MSRSSTMVLRLLLILIAFVILLRLLGWRPPAQRRGEPGAPSGAAPSGAAPAASAQDGELVQCAACSVYLPRQQALSRDGHWYCCAEHRDRR